MDFPQVAWRLPDWVAKLSDKLELRRARPSREERMHLAIELARLNVEHGTGGPFGAAVFERDSGRLIAPGVNLVLSVGCSAAHAEVVAITMAQLAMGTHDLGGPGLPDCELAASVEPCAMCLGAICWSGVTSLLCGANDDDAIAVGFDEGFKPPDWADACRRRGIAVTHDVLRAQAAEVLRLYRDRGGVIYNPRSGRRSGERSGAQTDAPTNAQADARRERRG